MFNKSTSTLMGDYKKELKTINKQNSFPNVPYILQ